MDWNSLRSIPPLAQTLPERAQRIPRTEDKAINLNNLAECARKEF
jgi:hypothetical protein